MGQFADDLAKFEAKTLPKFDLAVRKIALELFSRVILKSPVDTGRFRGNWQVSIGAIPTGTLEINDRAGQIAINDATARTAGLEAGDVVYLVNNLPYGPRLETGYSAQAPAGMIALSVQEFQQIANQVGLELVQI